MYDAALFMEIPDPMSDLDDYVPGKVFGEVGELYDLVEQFSALAVEVRGHVSNLVRENKRDRDKQELENEKVMIARVDKGDELDDGFVAEIAHDLHFLEDVGAL
jgi:hypothetical protein